MSRIKIGDRVAYHSVINGPVASINHEVEQILLAPNNFGADVAWITGKSGCVALAALTPMTEVPALWLNRRAYVEPLDDDPFDDPFEGVIVGVTSFNGQTLLQVRAPNAMTWAVGPSQVRLVDEEPIAVVPSVSADGTVVAITPHEVTVRMPVIPAFLTPGTDVRLVQC